APDPRHARRAGLRVRVPGGDAARAGRARRGRDRLARPEHLLRRRAGGDAPRRAVRGRGRPAPGRRRGGRRAVTDTTTIRQALPGDAGALAALYSAERAFLAPFEPDRGASFFTEATQRVRLAELAERRRAGAGDAWVIVDAGEPAGVISLSNVVRGP